VSKDDRPLGNKTSLATDEVAFADITICRNAWIVRIFDTNLDSAVPASTWAT